MNSEWSGWKQVKLVEENGTFEIQFLECFTPTEGQWAEIEIDTDYGVAYMRLKSAR